MAEQVLIEGGRVIDPARDFDARADVLLVGDRVAEISTTPGAIVAGDDATRIDAEGCIVSPGLIDIHVHLREPGEGHEETIATGSASALEGGFSTICCMPNTTPPLDTAERVRFVQERAAEAAAARVFVVACATRHRNGQSLTAVHDLAEAGAVGISDDGDCLFNETVMSVALLGAKNHDLCFMQHCQDPLATEGAAMNAGPIAEELGLVGWPREAEESIIRRDVELNRAVGCRYHAQHLSSGGSADIIRAARADGLPVTGEASPHHLLLTEEACRDLGTVAKMNPPLRTQRDIDDLKAAIADGTITVLATDHAPHPAATKDRPFAEASFGIVGLECALPLYVRALITDGVIDWPRLLALMTIEPARLVGLDRRGFGRLEAGGPADVTIIDPSLEWTVDASAFASTGRNCPFDGWSVQGRAVATIVEGTVRLLRAGDRARP
jgi:dihydroorotase